MYLGICFRSCIGQDEQQFVSKLTVKLQMGQMVATWCVRSSLCVGIVHARILCVCVGVCIFLLSFSSHFFEQATAMCSLHLLPQKTELIHWGPCCDLDEPTWHIKPAFCLCACVWVCVGVGVFVCVCLHVVPLIFPFVSEDKTFGNDCNKPN